MKDRKFLIKKGYIIREIAGEYLAVPVDSSSGAHIIILNPVSKFIWEELLTEKSFDELLQSIIKTFDNADESEAKTDLQEFLTNLEENNLLV